MKVVCLVVVPVQQGHTALVLSVILSTGSLRSNDLLGLGPKRMGLPDVVNGGLVHIWAVIM